MAIEIELEVPEHLDGERLDKVVAALLGLSRAEAGRVVGAGARIDGRPARASDRVEGGSVLRCREPGERLKLEAEDVPFDVIHEDDDIVVVDKPAGMVVHPGAGQRRGTLAAGLLHRYPELEGVGDEGRWGFIHRLDKNTSGVLVVSRNQRSFEYLKEQIRSRSMGRAYLALVEGTMVSPTGTIDAPIARDPAHPTKRAVVHGGKAARTHYEVVGHYPGAGCSLLSVHLDTGRTHQIRVHLAAIGHPVVGDWTYGAGRRDLGAPRTFLHASRVDLTHPTTGEPISIESPLPTDLTAVLAQLT